MALASDVILDEQMSKNSITVVACLHRGAGNDPGEGGQEGGGREMGRGQWGGGDWDGETGETEMGRWGGGGEGGEELARARSGKERRWEGGQEGVGWGRGDRIGTMGSRLGGGNGEGKMERGQLEGGDGEGATGRGRREGGKGEGEKKGHEEEAFYRWI